MATKPLSRQRILKAAFALADKQGVEAVTMRAVASALGVEAMSLYHHVPNKRAMLDGLSDLLVQAAGIPSGDVTAEEWLRGTAAGLRALAAKHPRLVPIFSMFAVPLDDPAAAEPFESGLRAFTGLGYDLTGAFGAVQAALVSFLAMAQLEATAQLADETENQTHLEALPADAFPLLHRVAEAPAGIEEFWQVLVDALVKGLDRP